MHHPKPAVSTARRRIDIAAAAVVAVALLSVTAMTIAQPRRDNPNGSWKARASWSTASPGANFSNIQMDGANGSGTFKSLDQMNFAASNSNLSNVRTKGKVFFNKNINPNNDGNQMATSDKQRVQLNYNDGQRDTYKFGKQRFTFQKNSSGKWIFRGNARGDLQKHKLPNGNTVKPDGQMAISYKFVTS
ncbi:MAG: hypothetical protein AAGK09_08805 [Planctomycetota bacterium]